MRIKFRYRQIVACRWIVLFFGLTLLTGCGNKEGIKVTGTVTFEGEPVPQGTIIFAPDRRDGNDGATALADIKDGVIQLQDRLVVPGPSRMQISTFDGVPFQMGEHSMKSGKPLISMQLVDVELPPSNAELTITMKKVSEMSAEVDVQVQ